MSDKTVNRQNGVKFRLSIVVPPGGAIDLADGAEELRIQAQFRTAESSLRTGWALGKQLPSPRETGGDGCDWTCSLSLGMGTALNRSSGGTVGLLAQLDMSRGRPSYYRIRDR